MSEAENAPEVEPKHELKESLELVAALELAGVTGVKIAKGGLKDPKSLEAALHLLQNAGVIVEGFKGIDQVDDEIKDLDEQELIQLGMAAFGLYKKVRAAYKEVA